MCHCLPVCELLHSIADSYLLKEIISWVSLSLYHGEMEKQTVYPCFQKSATFHIIPNNLAALKARVSHILLPNVFALETCDSFSALRAIVHQLCTHTPGSTVAYPFAASDKRWAVMLQSLQSLQRREPGSEVEKEAKLRRYLYLLIAFKLSHKPGYNGRRHWYMMWSRNRNRWPHCTSSPPEQCSLHSEMW